MRFSRTWTLAADPAGVRAQSIDAAGRRAACRLDGSRDVEVSVAPHGTGSDVTISRAVATGAEGPGVAVVGRFLRMVQTEHWHEPAADGTVGADIDITFPGRPIAVTARIEVVPAPDGCTQTLTGRATVRLPGVGRLVERRVVDSLLTAMDGHLGSVGRTNA